MLNRYEFEIVETHLRAAEAATREAQKALPWGHPKAETLHAIADHLAQTTDWLRDEMEEAEELAQEAREED